MLPRPGAFGVSPSSRCWFSGSCSRDKWRLCIVKLFVSVHPSMYLFLSVCLLDSSAFLVEKYLLSALHLDSYSMYLAVEYIVMGLLLDSGWNAHFQSFNEMKLLSIEHSEWIGNRMFRPCRPLSAVKTVLTANKGLRAKTTCYLFTCYVLCSEVSFHSLKLHSNEPIQHHFQSCSLGLAFHDFMVWSGSAPDTSRCDFKTPIGIWQ